VALILGSVMALEMEIEMEIERATETATETVIELAVKGVQLHREVALVALMLKVPVPTVVARVIAVAVPKIGVAIETAIAVLGLRLGVMHLAVIVVRNSVVRETKVA
jgi:hypothetical protein